MCVCVYITHKGHGAAIIINIHVNPLIIYYDKYLYNIHDGGDINVLMHALGITALFRSDKTTTKLSVSSKVCPARTLTL